MPRSRTSRTISTARLVSSRFMPANGSSRSRTLRIRGKADRDAERPKMAVRQVDGSLAAEMARSEEVEDLVGGAAERGLVLSRASAVPK